MSCHHQSAPPQNTAVKMSLLINICQEPILAAHVQSPPAGVSQHQAREDSAPHCVSTSDVLACIDHNLWGWCEEWDRRG